MSQRILITGSLGQIGTELGKRLRQLHGVNSVIMTDLRDDYNREAIEAGPFQKLDVLNGKKLAELVQKNKITTIYHLAALLSKSCEDHPETAWDLNINGTRNVLEVAKQYKCSVFTPSSIGVFGQYYDKDNVP
jgi:nucleoside-diphosphate-sugar epimerase